jgi:predicted metal-dependent phosphoesterase TrpH
VPADLHTHSEASSDSTLGIDERLELATQEGITTFAVTDHMAVHDQLTAREQQLDGKRVVTGIELNCTVWGQRIDILGHFIDPGRMRERVGSTTTTGITVEDGNDLDPATIINWIHDAGGAAALAHPGRYDLDLSRAVSLLVEAGLDGLEIEYPYEVYDVTRTGSPYTPVDEMRDLARTHELIQVGGSDCHGYDYRDGVTFMGEVHLPDRRVDLLRQRSEAYR